MAYGRLSHSRGPTSRLPTIYILNHQISLLTLNRSVDLAVCTLVCSRMYTMHQNPSYGFDRVENVICVNLRNTVNREKLLLIVMSDRIEYIHHTIRLTYTYRRFKTKNKTTSKNGLGAIKPRQRPNRSPTNYLYTKPSNQSTHPQSIR